MYFPSDGAESENLKKIKIHANNNKLARESGMIGSFLFVSFLMIKTER